MFKASKAVRFFFFVVSAVAFIGIWLSGFNNVHWFSYELPGFFLFAAITGFCPGMIISKKIFGES